MNIEQFGLYCVKDDYFDKFKTFNDFKDNKRENRPHYCTFIDKDNIIWLIPLSSQTETYKKKIEKDEQTYKECLFYHIGKVNGTERVFLIGKMFPTTEVFIKKPFIFSNKPYVIENEELTKKLNKKSKKFLSLVKNGKLSPDIDIMSIKAALLK